MIATIRLFTPHREDLATVEAHDLAPFVTLTLHGRAVHLTREQARQLSDALRAAALTSPAEILGSSLSGIGEGEW